ncbi:MAG: hypothetical protein II393_03995 [Cytophagales bacterium]|nr:hypothetical protein [Cytophagales bacterium]
MVFELVKDKHIYNAADFKRKIMADYGLSQKSAADLFVRVNNYQLEKYGDVLIKRTFKRRKVRGTDGVYTFKEI